MKKASKRPPRSKDAGKGKRAQDEMERATHEFEDRQRPPSGEPHPEPFTPPGKRQAPRGRGS